MKAVEQLHNEAMKTLDDAYVARMGGQSAEYRQLLKAAFETEREAAMLLRDRMDVEPTRGILFKGAAVLAEQCELFAEAADLLDLGLSGNPPAWLDAELRDFRNELKLPARSSTPRPSRLKRLDKQPVP